MVWPACRCCCARHDGAIRRPPAPVIAATPTTGAYRMCMTPSHQHMRHAGRNGLTREGRLRSAVVASRGGFHPLSESTPLAPRSRTRPGPCPSTPSPARPIVSRLAVGLKLTMIELNPIRVRRVPEGRILPELSRVGRRARAHQLHREVIPDGRDLGCHARPLRERDGAALSEGDRWPRCEVLPPPLARYRASWLAAGVLAPACRGR